MGFFSAIAQLVIVPRACTLSLLARLSVLPSVQLLKFSTGSFIDLDFVSQPDRHDNTIYLLIVDQYSSAKWAIAARKTTTPWTTAASSRATAGRLALRHRRSKALTLQP